MLAPAETAHLGSLRTNRGIDAFIGRRFTPTVRLSTGEALQALLKFDRLPLGTSSARTQLGSVSARSGPRTMQQQRIGLRPGLGSRPAAVPHGQPGARPHGSRLIKSHQVIGRLDRRNAPVRAAAGQQDAGGTGGAAAAVGLFPAGKRQARVQLPALFLSVTAGEALDAAGSEAVGAAVAGGATAVVLQQGDSAGELYAAAVRLKELLRGRAALLIADRTDIVEAAGADGALLTPDGLPTVVAKRNLRDGLALVGRAVGAAEEAAEAAADGANFVVLAHPAGGAAPGGAEVAAARTQQRSSASIPVLAAADAGASSGELAALLQAGADGLMLRPADLCPVAGALSGLQPTNAADAAAALLQLLGSAAAGDAAAAEAAPAAAAQQAAEAAEAGQQQAAQLSQLLSSSREELVDAERVFFTEVGGRCESCMRCCWLVERYASPWKAGGCMPPPCLRSKWGRAAQVCYAWRMPAPSSCPPALRLNEPRNTQRTFRLFHNACHASDITLLPPPPAPRVSPQALAFLERWCPALEEAQLLRDSIRQLDELFLLVVLGEFNSGGCCAAAQAARRLPKRAPRPPPGLHTACCAHAVPTLEGKNTARPPCTRCIAPAAARQRLPAVSAVGTVMEATRPHGPCAPPPSASPAGKSAVVNALLGQRYLAEGILPTTNEINVLKHLDPEHVESAAQAGWGWGIARGRLEAGRQPRGWQPAAGPCPCCSLGHGAYCDSSGRGRAVPTQRARRTAEGPPGFGLLAAPPPLSPGPVAAVRS